MKKQYGEATVVLSVVPLDGLLVRADSASCVHECVTIIPVLIIVFQLFCDKLKSYQAQGIIDIKNDVLYSDRKYSLLGYSTDTNAESKWH